MGFHRNILENSLFVLAPRIELGLQEWKSWGLTVSRYEHHLCGKRGTRTPELRREQIYSLRQLPLCDLPKFTEREIELSLRFSLVSLYFAATTVWMFPLQQSTHIIVVTLPPLTHLILSPNELRLRLSYVTSRNTCPFFCDAKLRIIFDMTKFFSNFFLKKNYFFLLGSNNRIELFSSEPQSEVLPLN